MKRKTAILVALIILSTAGRVAFALDQDVDPLSGQDSPAYQVAAIDLADGGFDGTVGEIPRIPPGYPFFVAVIYKVFGNGTRAVGAIQGLLIGLAAWVLFVSSRDLFGENTAMLAGGLFTVNPGLSGSAAHLMYEPLLAFLLVVAIAALLRGWAIAGLGLIGLASIIQPKSLVVGLFLLAWLLWKNRRVLALSAVALLVAPAIVIIANHSTYGAWGISANFGMTIQSGFNNDADGTWRVFGPGIYDDCPPLPTDPFARDRALTRCALSWMIDHPERLPELTAMKAMTFWSPLTGPLTTRSTWHGDFDFRNVYPAWVTEDPTFMQIDLVVSNLWIAVTVLLLIWGFLLVRADSLSLLALAPIVAFFLVTLGTIGDARFRLPVVGFCLLFQSRALVELGRWAAAKSPTLRSRYLPMPHPSSPTIGA